jgi:predicted RNase H-like HicB family nuclease
MKVRDAIQMVERDGVKYAVIFETGSGGGYSAYAPDLPGCVAAAPTLEEAGALMEDAIEFHIEGMRLHGEIVPEPSSLAEMLEVA